MPEFELFGSPGCPYTAEMREWLEWNGHEYVEHDVDTDDRARARMIEISGGLHIVPVLLEKNAGKDPVVQIGWQGRGCVVRG